MMWTLKSSSEAPRQKIVRVYNNVEDGVHDSMIEIWLSKSEEWFEINERNLTEQTENSERF